VAVFTGTTYTDASALDTVIEGDNATTIAQDFFAIYQDGFQQVRVAIVESDGSENGTADFTVTDVFRLTNVNISTVSSLINITSGTDGDIIVQ